MRIALPDPARGLLGRWPVRSHRGSRRNALVASTALTQRRRERAEVDEFMAGYLARRARTDRPA